jgi:hypothetical protein
MTTADNNGHHQQEDQQDNVSDEHRTEPKLRFILPKVGPS